MKAVQYLEPADVPVTVYDRDQETANSILRRSYFVDSPQIKAILELGQGAVTSKGKPVSIAPTSGWGRRYSEGEEVDWTIGVDTFQGTAFMRPGDWLIRAEDNTLRVESDSEYRRWFG